MDTEYGLVTHGGLDEVPEPIICKFDTEKYMFLLRRTLTNEVDDLCYWWPKSLPVHMFTVKKLQFNEFTEDQQRQIIEANLNG